MFASVHCCTGNLALEVSDLKFFGILPTASLYLGTRTMVVKETIRINPWQESAASNRILAELEPLSSDVRRSPFIIHRSAFTVRRSPFGVKVIREASPEPRANRIAFLILRLTVRIPSFTAREAHLPNVLTGLAPANSERERRTANGER
jgi:hypothetical protein